MEKYTDAQLNALYPGSHLEVKMLISAERIRRQNIRHLYGTMSIDCVEGVVEFSQWARAGREVWHEPTLGL